MACSSSEAAEPLSTKPEPPARKASDARSGSSFTVKKITLTAGIRRLSWRAASRPLSDGMETSSTTMSGRSPGAASSRARPSPTAPTTSQVGSSSLMKASRSSRWSSARRTRGRLMTPSYALGLVRGAQREPDVDPGAARRPRVDGDRAAQMKYPLTHADQPEPFLALDQRGVESGAVIDDSQGHRIGASPEVHRGVVGAAVLDDIAQPFLHEALEAHGRVRGNGCQHSVRSEFDFQAVGLGQLPAEAADRRDEPQLLQLGRVQLVRQVVHGRGQLSGSSHQLLQAAAELICRCRRVLAEELHFHGQERQALVQIVVELASNPPRFGLLSDKEPAGQRPKLGRPHPHALLELGALVLDLPEESRVLSFRYLSCNELPDLASGGVEHLKQVGVWLPDLLAEKLHHAKEPVRSDDREAECPVESVPGRRLRPGEIRILGDIGNPRGSTAAPDPAREAHAGRERRLAALVCEVLPYPGWRHPDVAAAQHVALGIDAPANRHDPVQARADRFENLRHRLREGS